MKSEIKKFRVKRELKFRIPEQSLKEITKACTGYGNGQIVAEASGLSYNTVAEVLKTKLATKKVLNSLLEGIEQIKQAAYGFDNSSITRETIASDAVKMADALIAELNKEVKP